MKTKCSKTTIVVDWFSACFASRSSRHPVTRHSSATAHFQPLQAWTCHTCNKNQCFHWRRFCYLDLWPKVPGWPPQPITIFAQSQGNLDSFLNHSTQAIWLSAAEHKKYHIRIYEQKMKSYFKSCLSFSYSNELMSHISTKITIFS